MYRKSWIDEGKPGHVRREEVDEAFEHQDTAMAHNRPVSSDADKKNTNDITEDVEEDPASMFFGDSSEATAHNQNEDGPDDDELDALLAQEPDRPTTSTTKPVDEDSEGEDDLDAILAQSFTRSTNNRSSEDKSSTSTSQHHHDHDTPGEANKINAEPVSRSQDEDEDDLDALLALNEPSSNSNTQQLVQQSQPQNEFSEDDFPDDDMDDLDALLNSNKDNTTEPELPSNPQPATPTKRNPDQVPNSEEIPELDNVISSSPIPDVHTDELDQLMDEHDATVAQQQKEQKRADPEILEEFMSSSPIQSGGA